jgi:acetolactate synthase-1/2/3 large subunit
MNSSFDRSISGAEAIVSTLADHGVSACFANPGTSEMHLVTALDHEPRIQSVLCLFEGVATGAADGFGRVTGDPAMTLLHLGAGYLNGGANIHNARRAWTPMVNVIGDHAVPHRRHDAPLASDIVGMAGPNSVWIKSADVVSAAGELAAEAWEASLSPLSGPASLVLPADTAWSEGGRPGRKRSRPSLRAPEAARIEAAAKAIKCASRPMILINGSALTEAGLAMAARLKAAGVRVMTDTFFPRQARGAGRFTPDRMQYFAEGAMGDLEGCDLMLVAGTQVPVAFFAYPGKPSVLVPDGCTPMILGGPESDSAAALEALADALNAKEAAPMTTLERPSMPRGDLNAIAVGLSIARHMPEGTFVSTMLYRTGCRPS